VYTLRLTVTAAGGKVSTDTVTVSMLIVGAPYDSVDPFSPNGDGIKDTTVITSTLSLSTNWTLTIKNSAAVIVRTYTGTGTAITQSWDGKNTAGVKVPDGVYTYQVSAVNPGGGAALLSTTSTTTVDATAPTAVITAPTEGKIFLTDAAVAITGTANDARFMNAQLEYGFGANPASFTLAKSFVIGVPTGTLHSLAVQGWAAGTYTLRLTVNDLAGNRTQILRHFTLDHVQVSAVTVSPAIVDPVAGQQAGIQFTLARPANVTIRIYNFAYNTTASKQLVRTLTLPARPAGLNSVPWDGKNATNVLLPATHAYYFTIQAIDTTNTLRQGSYGNATSPALAPVPETINASVNATNFDPYKNTLVSIAYTFTQTGWLQIQIWDQANVSVRDILAWGPLPAGNHVLYWDGRKTDGKMFSGAFSVYFGVPHSVPVNAILIKGTPIEFQNFQAEAYVIQPTFAQVSSLRYTLSKEAKVSVTLIDPNGVTVRKLLTNVQQPPGAQTLEWDGRNDAGRFVAVEGSYRVVMTAVDLLSGASSTRTGSIVVYK
jgi:flagellar hook assembly protein FlgD